MTDINQTDKIWVINKGSQDFEKTDMDLKRHIVIKPIHDPDGVPVALPRSIAIKYATSYQTISICDNPDDYFKDKKFNQLIIRDAGIGDLLLLEPLIRTLVKKGNRNISILSQFPDVYKYNPCITDNIQMQNKGQVNIKLDLYDAYDDLRNYSEQCANRDRIHRTDCYNQVLNVELSDADKEPRLYFNKDEKSILKKKKGFLYIGLQCDASHIYRQYEKGVELINYLLKQNNKYVIILLGSEKYVEYKYNKRVIDMQGQTNARECINVIRDLDYMIGVDSGLIHVAMTMHIPTVCIFTIISPELRLKYYRGQYEVVTADCDCIGCGDLHMMACRDGDKRNDLSFEPKCLKLSPAEIYNKLCNLNPVDEKLIYYSDEKDNIKQRDNITNIKPIINVKKYTKKLTMPIIVLDEEKNLPRFIELVMSHPSIDRVIAIDGGSKDNTVKLLKKAGAEVYEHYYDKNYHDAQAMQRNISFSYVPDGKKCIVMDIDECFSRELFKYLPIFAEQSIDYGLLSRRTYKYYAHVNDPNKQIKDYPDWQPRLFIMNRRFKWCQSPHHEVYNVPQAVNINKDIIHFECEGKSREDLEKLWSKMQKRTKEVYL